MFFNPGGTDVSAPDAQFSLGYVAAQLDLDKRLQILVVGHADVRGSDDVTRMLALRRANAVRAALVAHGIDASRIAIAAPKSRDDLTSPTLARRADLYVHDPAREDVGKRVGYAIELRKE